MYTTRKHSTYTLSDTSAELCRKGKEGSQPPRKQNHPAWQVNPPANQRAPGHCDFKKASRPMKKEMGLIWRQMGPSFSKRTGLNSSKEQEKVGSLSRCVKRKPDTGIYLSIPSLLDSWQRKGLANCKGSQCSSRHIKEKEFPSGWGMATSLRGGNGAKLISLALRRESSSKELVSLTRLLLYPQDAMKVHPCSVKPNLRAKAICKAHHRLSISQRSCNSWVCALSWGTQAQQWLCSHIFFSAQ